MDKQGECVADIDRYAFLLGSALKNCDDEQFFCIYDSIIPADLPLPQVEWIKEKARYISELPDDDFNELVVNARDFSLARGRLHPPPSSVAMSTNGQRLLDEPRDDDVDSGRVSRSSRVPQLNLHFRPPCNSLSINSNGAGMTDDDSGLPSSTKSGRRPSLSSSDDQAEMEEKGCSLFRQTPDRSLKSKARASERWESGDQAPKEGETMEMPPILRVGESVVVSHTYKPHYDEAIMVEHDNESVESPRSDASSTREYDLLNQLDSEDLLGRQGVANDGSVIVDIGTIDGDQEMKMINKQSIPYRDFDDDDDSDGNDNIHRKLYGRHHATSLPMDRPRASSTSSISSSILAREQSISSLRRSGGASVDDSVQFSSLSGVAGGASSNHHTQSRYSPDCVSALSPPFGSEKPNLLEKVGHSICSLVQTPSYNMSQMTSEGGATGDGKKKKKKKKDGKDESTREGGSRSKSLMTTDVNGNPHIDPISYRGMRDPPRPHDSISPVSGSRGRSTAANHDCSSGRGDLQEMGNKSDDPTSPTGSSGNNGQTRKRKGSKKASNPGKEIKPEDDPNYVGNINDIDSLVEFINSDIDPEKLRKNSKAPEDGGGNKTTPASANAPLGKTVKKLKDRGSIKTKQLQTVGVGENAEDSLTPASETTQLLSSATSLKSSYSSTCERVPCEQTSECKDNQAGRSLDEQKVAKEMGNSSSSKLSGGDDEEVTPPQEISEPVKNHKVQEQSISTSLPSKSAADSSKNLTNNRLLNSGKQSSTLKKDQTGEAKDCSKESKGKAKGGSKDNSNKNDSSVSCTDNNNKKNKAKPSKSDVKTDLKASEKVSPTESKKDAKVETKDPSPSVSSPSKFELANVDNFIFTDTDIHSEVEPEFTTVVAKSKKKKRPAPQMVPQGERNGSNSFQSFSQHHYSSKEAQTFPSYQQSFASCPRTVLSQISSPPPHQHHNYHSHSKRSFTPPPLHAIRDNSSVGGNNSDLSLNAFPKLSSDHSGPRRRSMENLYENVNSFDKDSDKESTKSLPADKGVGGRGSVCGGGASCFPVSYATMVSIKTPRQSVDSSKAESVSSSMEDANVEEFPTPSTTSMKWKGSPQERRHSIGSAPEELSKTSGNSSTLQRSGSQEVLSRDSDSLDISSTVAKSGGVPGAVTGMTQSDSACSFAGSDADSARGSEAGFETVGEVFATSNSASSVTVTTTEEKKTVADDKNTKTTTVSKTSTIPTGSVSRAPSQTVNSTVSGGSSGGNNNTPSAAATAVVKSKVTQQSSSSSRSQATPTVAVSTSKPNVTVKMTPLVTKPVNNGHKNKNCVVFCNTSQKDIFTVDVSFGGDPLFSIDGQLESSVSTKPSCGGSSSVTTVPPPAKDKVCSSKVTTPSSQLPSKTVAAAASSSSSDIHSINKPLKGPHIAGLNGLVSPRPTETQPVLVLQASSTVPTTTSSSPAETQQGQTVSQTGSPCVNFEGPSASSGTDVVAPVVKTEKVLPPNTDHGDVNVSVPKGGIALAIGTKIQAKKPQFKIFIQPEPAAVPTSQARMEVVTFFTKGWMKVETELKNDASSLRVYSSQD